MRYFKHNIIALFSIAIFFGVSCANNKAPNKAPEVITVETLLQEMVSRDQITRFPSPYYESLQASSYNRESESPDKAGWFADSDGIGYIRTEERNGETEYVMMEDFGPGAITKIWAVCFYYGLNDVTGGNIRIYLDGAEEPVVDENFFDLVQGKSFAKAPLADISTRAGNLYFPITYAKSCKITHDRKSFYNIINYRSYAEGTKVETFSRELLKKYEVIIAQVSEQLNSKPKTKGKQQSEKLTIAPSEKQNIELPKGSKAIHNLVVKLNTKGEMNQALRSTVMRATFDGEETIWCPLGDFFASGVGGKEYSMWERSVYADGAMECRWIMPYAKNGELEFINLGKEQVELDVSVTSNKYEWDDRSMHFHANWRMDNPTPTFPLFDWNLLQVDGQGVFVGDHITVLQSKEGWWGEGDEKIYVDNDFEEKFPSHFGTGTEDYYGWAGGVVPTSKDEFSKPFIANIKVSDPRSKGYNTCSRTRALDAIPFKQKFRFDLESSCGQRNSWFHLVYAMTSFWYAKPNAVHNRKPLPEMAARRLMTVEDLFRFNEEAKNSVYIVDGVIEAENLNFVASKGVEAISNANVWGDLSGGKMVHYETTDRKQSITVQLTEQFEAAEIEIGGAVGPAFGEYEIWVNDEKKATANFRSGHSGITNPYVKLSDCEPKENKFVVEFRSTADKPSQLGVDFFKVNIK